ncbi:MAG: twin-arginine translocase TatA/TatE family subunit [Verrucomicrobia bacterium]|nr:twin-arginine translocase TatA/TatE family subunit [Verrucomicrobiota bacterium]
MFAMLNGWEILLLLLLALILFGAKKLPELARGLGQGIREFKKSTREVQDELENAVNLDAPPPPPPPRKLPPDTQPRSNESGDINEAVREREERREGTYTGTAKQG